MFGHANQITPPITTAPSKTIISGNPMLRTTRHPFVRLHHMRTHVAVAVVPCPSPSLGGKIGRRSKKRHEDPPDEYAFHDSDRGINRTQAFKLRFQVALALAALPRIRFGVSPAAWTLQNFSHGQPIISATTSAGKPVPVSAPAAIRAAIQPVQTRPTTHWYA